MEDCNQPTKAFTTLLMQKPGAIKEMSEAEFEEKAKKESLISSIYKTHNEKTTLRLRHLVP